MSVEWYPEIASWEDVDFDWENGFKSLRHFDHKVFIALLKATFERLAVSRDFYSDRYAYYPYYYYDTSNGTLFDCFHKLARIRFQGGKYGFDTDILPKVLACINLSIYNIINSSQRWLKTDSLSDCSSIYTAEIRQNYSNDQVAQAIGYETWEDVPRFCYNSDFANMNLLSLLSSKDNKLSEWITACYKIINLFKYKAYGGGISSLRYALFNWQGKRTPYDPYNNENNKNTWSSAVNQLKSLNWGDALIHGGWEGDGQYLDPSTASRYFNSEGDYYELNTLSVNRIKDFEWHEPGLNYLDAAKYIDIPHPKLDIYLKGTGSNPLFIGRLNQVDKFILIKSYEDNAEYIDGKHTFDVESITDDDISGIACPPFNPPAENEPNPIAGNCSRSIEYDGYIVEKFDGPNGFKFIAGNE